MNNSCSNGSRHCIRIWTVAITNLRSWKQAEIVRIDNEYSNCRLQKRALTKTLKVVFSSVCILVKYVNLNQFAAKPGSKVFLCVLTDKLWPVLH
ncbi:unnamed protein product [Schistosoma spindalis]|nr:unnamed protein product [Schistosoma spindale]